MNLHVPEVINGGVHAGNFLAFQAPSGAPQSLELSECSYLEALLT